MSEIYLIHQYQNICRFIEAPRSPATAGRGIFDRKEVCYFSDSLATPPPSKLWGMRSLLRFKFQPAIPVAKIQLYLLCQSIICLNNRINHIISLRVGGRSFRAFLTSWLIYDRGCGMPRLARLDAPGVLHHVMGRGIERKNIFWNDKDRSDFIDRLAGVVERGAGIYSRTGTPVK